MRPDRATSSMFRWWIPAGFVDDKEIVAELKAIADAGYKGVEICINMSDTGYTREMAKEKGWGTARWRLPPM